MAADRVDFVDEHDARGRLLGLLEHVADAAGADADEHLDEVRTGNGEERNARLTGDGAREQRLAGAGRADQQRALGDLAAKPRELARILQVLDDFLKLLARLVDAGDIGKGYAALLFGQHPGAALAEAHRSATGVLLHLAHDEEADSEDQQEWQRLVEKDQPHARLLFGLYRDPDALPDETVGDIGVGRCNGPKRLSVIHLAADRDVADRRGGNDHRLDIALVDLLDELRISQRLALRGASAVEGADEQYQSEQYRDPDEKRLGPGVAGLLLVPLFVHVIQSSNGAAKIGSFPLMTMEWRSNAAWRRQGEAPL